MVEGIGKCVFVFAGGTATTYDEFKGRSERGAGSSSEAIISFRNKKGPDFVSRLDAYLDVLGPNPRTISDICKRRKPDPNDMLYSLRRALLIRHFLHCGETDRIDFDTGLLNALLRVPAYRHGARSLEKLMENIRRDNGVSVRRSTLPLRAQLEMHVDPEEFLGYLDRESPLPVLDFTWQQIEKSASCIHEAWKVRQTDCKHRVDDARNVALSDLPDPYREANRAAVARMPMILDMAGLKLSEGNAPAGLLANQYEEHIAPIIEYLSEVEHNGWVNQRVSSGWRYNKDRDERDGRHPAMVPYAQLVERYKDNDRGNIRLYHAICIGAGRSIVRK